MTTCTAEGLLDQRAQGHRDRLVDGGIVVADIDQDLAIDGAAGERFDNGFAGQGIDQDFGMGGRLGMRADLDAVLVAAGLARAEHHVMPEFRQLAADGTAHLSGSQNAKSHRHLRF